MSRRMRGDWDRPNYYERRRKEDEDKLIRQIAIESEGGGTLSPHLIEAVVSGRAKLFAREMVAQEPFDEMRNWAMQMNAHFEGEGLDDVVATTVRSRRIILIIDHDLQFDDLVRLVRRVDMIQQTHFREPLWEVEFAVRGRIDSEEIFVPHRRGVDAMARNPLDVGHRVSGHRVRSISNHEFNLLVVDADRYR